MPKYDDAHRDALRAETEAKKNLVRPLVPLVLERARDLLDDKTRWTKGSVARNEGGRQCMPDDPDAVTWCAVGALEKSAREVWAESRLSSMGIKDGRTTLSLIAQEAALPHIVQAAREMEREVEVTFRHPVSIPQINDRAAQGGYAAVINGLYLATGKTITDRVAKFVKRSQAARKAWETRKAKQVEEWRAFMARRNEERAAREALAEQARQTMVIGGTVPSVSPQINVGSADSADAKEIEHVSSR